MKPGDFIGRDAERAELGSALESAVSGEGSVVLLSGEAGVGKTRLAEEVLARSDGVTFVRGAATPGAAPFGPIVGALRNFLRIDPGGLADCGPLRPHLALLLPELGDARPTPDRATQFESIRCALVAIVARGPAAVLLDDVQWSDEATLELISTLATNVVDLPLLLVAAYRSDELARAHPLRRLRNDLRRDRALREVALGPLAPDESALLVEQVLGEAPSARLAATLHARTGGVPFFVEELTAALSAGGRLAEGPDGPELALDADAPLPQSVRDAVLVRIAPLSEDARVVAETAAGLGGAFAIELVAEVAGEDGISELLASGLVRETRPGWAAFPHPLAREAIYDDMPWLRRKALHRSLAKALHARDADPAEIATHWVAARDTPEALEALEDAIAASAEVHAYRDAARFGRQMLDLWPEGERGADRLTAVGRYARHAELAGDLPEAARAQREVVAARRAAGADRALADAERRIAGIYALQGDRERALAARHVAADAFAANGLPGEAAADRLVVAGYLQSAGRHADAAEAARQAGEEAVRAERADLRARAMGLEGVARVKGGSFEEGVETIRAGLSLALEHELTTEAAEVYQRLGTAHEIAGDYGGARDALGAAIGLCERGEAGDLEQVCLSCMAYVLRELGDWDEVVQLCEALLVPDATPDDTLVADGILGSVLVWRGAPEQGRPLLERCLKTTARLDVVSMHCDSAAVLGWLAAEEGDGERASDLGRVVLERWRRSEDHHYAVWGLRWAAAHFARSGASEDARACAEALSQIATSAGHADALAALAHALAEIALADGETEAAVRQFDRALALHDDLDIPFERAQILLRAGVALVDTGERERGLARLAEAHEVARGVGADPLATAAAAAIVAAGAALEDHLGSRGAARYSGAGLSPRELEVMRLVAEGLTNRQIAEQLVLSTRTVDMHVRNILTKLRCSTRTEAASRAADLGLLVS